MERFLVYFSRVSNLIIKIVYRARFWMRNEMKISRYIYIYQVLSLSIWKLKFSYTELVAHSTKSFHFLGLTLCFQLNKEEEWREERKKNEKNKKKEMKERTSRKEEGAEGCVERLKMFHSIVGGAKIDFGCRSIQETTIVLPDPRFRLELRAASISLKRRSRW